MEQKIINGWTITGKRLLARGPVYVSYAFRPGYGDCDKYDFSVAVDCNGWDKPKESQIEVANALAEGIAAAKGFLNLWSQGGHYVYKYPHNPTSNKSLEDFVSLLLPPFRQSYERGQQVDLDSDCVALALDSTKDQVSAAFQYLSDQNLVKPIAVGGQYAMTAHGRDQLARYPRSIGLEIEKILTQTVERLNAIEPGLGSDFDKHIKDAPIHSAAGLDASGYADVTRKMFERITTEVVKVLGLPTGDIAKTHNKAAAISKEIKSRRLAEHLVSISDLLVDQTDGFNAYMMRSLHGDTKSLEKFVIYFLLLVSDWMDITEQARDSRAR